MQRVRATVRLLKGSRFKGDCGTKTAKHGGDDKKCKLYDRGGFLRHIGFDVGVSVEQLEEVRKFYPEKRFV